MKRIFSLTISISVLVYVFRRLNDLVAQVREQGEQIEKLKLQGEALRATLETQQQTLNEMAASFEATRSEILDGAARRMANWREELADLDSSN